MVDEIQGNINVNIDTSAAIASLKRLQGQISQFHTSMAKGGATANREAALLQQSLINNINKTGQFSASMTRVASSTEAFTTALESNKLSMGQHFRYAMASTRMFGKGFINEFNTIQKVAESRVRTLQTQFIGLGRDANGALSAIKVRPLILDMNDLATKTQIAAQKAQIFNKLVNQGATNLLNWGKNTQWAGRQLMVGFTIPLTIFASTASKAFMEIEKQVIAFKRVYGDFSTTKKQTDDMAESVKALANEFTQYGIAVKDTMSLAAKAAAMGKTGADLTAQIKETSRLAVLGQVDQQQALDTTISLTNAFGLAADQLAGKIDFLNAVENQTVTSIEDLTVAIPKAGPVIQQLGGNVEDLSFLLTAMREGGINASEGANALKSGLAALINPTKAASDMLAGYGINIQQMVQSDKGNVKKLIVDFASSLDKLDPLSRAKAIEQMFGKFQFSRISTLFQNVIKEGSQAQQVLKLASSSSQELAILSQRELSKVSESTTYKFEKAITDFQTALAPVGEQFLKLVTPIIEFGTKMLEKFNGLGDGVKGFITTIVAGVGVVGPVLLMTIGLFANAIANIISVVQFLRATFSGTAKGSKDVATSTEYMTQAQLVAEAAAAGLNQTHSRLIQTYNVERGALDNLTRAYQAAARAAGLPIMGAPIAGKGGTTVPPMPMGKKYAAGGVIRGPGSGTSDSIPAMLSNGEAVIPAKQTQKYAGLVQGIISGNVPGFAGGVILPSNLAKLGRTIKSRSVYEAPAEQANLGYLTSSMAGKAPENYLRQHSGSGGHSFEPFGVGGAYMRADGTPVMVKPVQNEQLARAEMFGTRIAREAHGLQAPEQRLVVIKDPTDLAGERRFLALESPYNSTFAPPGQQSFTKDEFFQQLVASLVRNDKDLQTANLWKNVLADVGPAGVFAKASGVRSLTADLPSMQEQAMINLLGVKGGARKDFALATADLARSMSPAQYSTGILKEIDKVLPRLKSTVNSFNLSPKEKPVYEAMIARLEAGKNVDWTQMQSVHSAAMPTAPKAQGFALGGFVGKKPLIKPIAKTQTTQANAKKPAAQAFDFDDTLINFEEYLKSSRAEQSKVPWKQRIKWWSDEELRGAIGVAKPKTPVINQLLKVQKEGKKIIILTARPNTADDITREHLAALGIDPNNIKIVSRDRSNPEMAKLKAPELKGKLAGQLINDFEIEAFYDDLLENRNALAALGIKTYDPLKMAKGGMIPGYANGIVSVPGPKGAGDVIPAMLSPGEAVIPTKMAKKYGGLINGMIADNIPGYSDGLGTKSVSYNGRNIPLAASANIEKFDKLIASVQSGAIGVENGAVILEETFASLSSEGRKISFKDFSGKLMSVTKAIEGSEIAINRINSTVASVPGEITLKQSKGTSLITDLESLNNPVLQDEYNRAKVAAEAAKTTRLAAGLPIGQSEQVDRAHLAPVSGAGKILSSGAGWHPDLWTPQASDENQMTEQLRMSADKRTALYDEYIKHLADERLSAEKAAAMIQKINQGLALSDEELLIQRNILQKMLADQSSAVHKSSGIKGYAVGSVGAATAREAYGFTPASGTRPAAATAAAMAEVDRQLAVTTYTEEGTRLVQVRADAIDAGIVTGFDAATQRNSPPQTAIDGGEDYGNALNTGVKSKIDDMEIAGEALGQATVNGTQAAVDDTKKPAGQRVSRRSGRLAGAVGGTSSQLLTIPDPQNPGMYISKYESDRRDAKREEIERRTKAAFGTKEQRKAFGIKTPIEKVGGKIAAGVKGMGGMGAGMGVSTAGGLLMMVPGMQEFGMGLSMLGSLFMMMPAAAAGVVAALAAVAFGVYKLIEAQEQQRQKAIALGNAAVMSQSALEKMSEDFGTVSVTQSRKAEQEIKLTKVTEDQITAGQQYITEMESGQKLLADVKAQQVAGVSTSEISQNVASNLANAVAQQVITKEQGNAIIAALGSATGNFGISSSAGSQFELYTRDLTKTAGKTSTDSLKLLQQKSAANQAELAAAYNQNSTEQFFELFNPAAMIADASGTSRKAQAKLQMSSTTTSSVNAYGQAVGGIDTINAAYDTKIKEAKTQKQITELERLRTIDVEKQKQIAADTYTEIEKQKDAISTTDFNNNFMENIKTNFAEDSPTRKTADAINALSDITDGDFKLRLQTQLQSGSLSAESIDVLLQYGENNKDFGSNYNLAIKKQGEQETLDLITYAQYAGGTEETINLLVNAYSTMDPETAKLVGLGTGAVASVGVNINGMDETKLKELGSLVKEIGDKKEVSLNFIRTKAGTQIYNDWKTVLKNRKMSASLLIKISAIGDIGILREYLRAKGIVSSAGGLNTTADALDKAGLMPNSNAARRWAIQQDKLNNPGGDITPPNAPGPGGGGGSAAATEDPIMARLQRRLARQNAMLAIISLKEEKINKLYDERKKALEEIAKINSNIADQQKDQLDLSDALARGDVAAAARAVQAQRATAAAYAQEQQMKALEEQRQNALDLVTFKGKTRKDIEAKIDILNMKIARREYRALRGPGAATGGMITGPGTATSDSIPARLSNGEYVVNAKSVNKVGVPFLNAINAPGFANGGKVNMAHLNKNGKNFDIYGQAFAQGGLFRDPQQAAAMAKAMGGKGAAGVWDRMWNGKQDLADTAAMFVPGMGNAFSAYASAGSFSRGDIGGGLLNALGAIPGFGNIIGGLSKIRLSGLKALMQTKNMIHGSKSAITKTLHPRDIPYTNGQLYGQSTYFGKDMKTWQENYKGYGSPYKVSMSPSAMWKIATSRGYATSKDVLKAGANPRLVNPLHGEKYDGELLQTLMNKKFIGYKDSKKGIFTSLLLGAHKGMNLKAMPGTLEAIAAKAKARNAEKLARETSMSNIVSKPGMKVYKAGQIPKPVFTKADGGYINIPHFKNGGYMTQGGLAQLHDKEFVMSQPAVKKYGVNNLQAMNKGEVDSSSVYNYSVTVNAATSSNADDIAQVVMQKIKQVEGTRLRGNRY